MHSVWTYNLVYNNPSSCSPGLASLLTCRSLSLPLLSFSPSSTLFCTVSFSLLASDFPSQAFLLSHLFSNPCLLNSCWHHLRERKKAPSVSMRWAPQLIHQLSSWTCSIILFGVSKTIRFNKREPHFAKPWALFSTWMRRFRKWDLSLNMSIARVTILLAVIVRLWNLCK